MNPMVKQLSLKSSKHPLASGYTSPKGSNTMTARDSSTQNPTNMYCTISIDSSVMGHRGYLMCRNMGDVTGHGGVLTKGQILSHTARYDNFSLNSDIPYIKGLFWVQRCTAAVDFTTNQPKRC